ncbi:MAG: hypothetical protein AAGC84_21245, partial [Pseudomonas sp.]
VGHAALKADFKCSRTQVRCALKPTFALPDLSPETLDRVKAKSTTGSASNPRTERNAAIKKPPALHLLAVFLLRDFGLLRQP